MNAVYITICGLVILFAFEIRFRVMSETLSSLKTEITRLEREILRLNEEVKLKQNIYEEHNPPA